VTDFVPINAVDPAAVEALLDRAFGRDRHNRTAYRLRDGMDSIPELSFAAIEAGALVGTIQCWPVALNGDDGSLSARSNAGRSLSTATIAVFTRSCWSARSRSNRPANAAG